MRHKLQNTKQQQRPQLIVYSIFTANFKYEMSAPFSFVIIKWELVSHEVRAESFSILDE